MFFYVLLIENKFDWLVDTGLSGTRTYINIQHSRFKFILYLFFNHYFVLFKE